MIIRFLPRWQMLLFAALLLALAGGPAAAQSPAPARITFHFERPGMDVLEYNFLLREDGTGNYEATVAKDPVQHSGSLYAEQTAAQPPAHFSGLYTLPGALTSRIFSQVRAADHLTKDCASKVKNIANTGIKTLSYTGPEGSGSCVYNYSADKSVSAVTDTFQAMFLTVNSGRLLAYDERFDRLGLDHDMNYLVQALKEGRAEAPGLIAPELKSLVSNEQVMQRVRRNASVLLDKASSAH